MMWGGGMCWGVRAHICLPTEEEVEKADHNMSISQLTASSQVVGIGLREQADGHSEVI